MTNDLTCPEDFESVRIIIYTACRCCHPAWLSPTQFWNVIAHYSEASV